MIEQELMSSSGWGNERLEQDRYAIAERDGSSLNVIEDKDE